MLKKALALSLSALLLLAAGCSRKPSGQGAGYEDPSALAKPEHPVALLFSGVKSADLDSIELACEIPEELLTEEVEGMAMNPIFQTAVKFLNRDLSYEVKKVVADEDAAVVTLTVNYPDASGYISRSFQKIAPAAYQTLLNGDGGKDELIRTVLSSLASDLLAEKFETVSETFDVNCIKQDGKWRLTYDDKLINSCSANCLSAIQSLDLSVLTAAPANE